MKINVKNYGAKSKIFLFLFAVSFIVVVSVFGFPFVVEKAQAATGINKQINFQGKLVDNNGLIVADNTYTVVFSLYSVSSAGSVIWTESDSVTTKAGIFQVALGANTNFPGNVDFNSDSLYLGIKVGSDAEMTPRIRFTAVPYAFNADKLDGVVATQSASGFTLTGGISNLKTLTLNDSTIFNNSGLTFANGRSVTVSGADITIGSTIQPTSAGGLTVDTNGANAMSLGTNANAITFGGSNNPTYLFSGNGGLTVNGTSVTLGNGSSSTIQTASGSNSGLTLLSQGTGNITLGQNAGNGNIFLAPNAGGQAALIIKDQGTGDLMTASAGATTKFVVNNNGNLQFTGNSGFLNTVGTTGSFASGQTYNLPNSGGTFCLSTNNCGFAAGTNYWQLNTNAISPANSTYDFLLGGNATTSARFAFTGTAGNATPVASIAATPASGTSTGLTLLGSGNIQSLNMGTLTIGGASTGIIVLNSGSNTTQLGDNTIQLTGSGPTISSTNTLTINAFTLGGNIAAAARNISNVGTLDLGSNNLSLTGTTISTSGNNTNLTLTPNGSGQVVLTSDALRGVVIGSTNTTAAPLVINGGIGNNGALIVNQKNSGDIIDASQGGTLKFSVANNGNIAATGTITGLTGITSSGTIQLSGLTNSSAFVVADSSKNLTTTNGAATSSELLNILSDETGTGVVVFGTTPTFTTNITDPMVIGGSAAGSTLTLESTSGAGTSDFLAFKTGSQAERMRVDSSGNVGIGSNFGATAAQATLDIRGINATTPAASVSAITNFAAMVVNNSGSGDLFTASSAGATKFTIKNSGSVVFGGNDTTISASGSGATNNGSGAVENVLGDEGSLVPNAGFEAFNNVGGFADGWVNSATSSATVTRDITTQAKGNGDAQIAGGVGQFAAFYSACMPLALTNQAGAALGAYDLAYYARTNTAAKLPTLRAYVDGYTSQVNCNQNKSAVASNPVNTTNLAANTNWNQITTTAAPVAFTGTPASLTWGRIHFYVAFGTAASQVNIDGVRLIQNVTNAGLDYAENYPADPNDVPEAGDLVSLIATGKTSMVTRTKKAMDQSAIGVVSTQPGYVLDDGSIADPKVTVALAGRVPVKVSTINGPIHVGDYLMSSNIPGVAVKAVSSGPVIGTAMEDDTDANTSDVNDVTMFIKNTYYNGAASLGSGLSLLSQAQDTSVLVNLLQGFAGASDSALTSISAGQAADGLNVLASILKNQITGTQSAQQANASSSASVLNEVMSSITTEGMATLPGDLRIKGNGLIEGVLHVVDTLFINNLIANGVSEFFGNVIFHSGVTFDNAPTFSNDTAGIAVVKKGSNSVEVKFSKSYDQTPIVNASITFNPLTPTPSETPDALSQRQKELEKALLKDNIQFIVTNRTSSGFTILLDKQASQDIAFSWLALSVHNPIIFQSQKPLSPSSTDISPSPIDTIIPTAATTSAGF